MLEIWSFQPHSLFGKRWRLQRQEEWEADRARKVAEEERAQMKLLDDTIAGLCANESLEASYFHSLVLNLLQVLR
jgi:hypothetical protein